MSSTRQRQSQKQPALVPGSTDARVTFEKPEGGTRVDLRRRCGVLRSASPLDRLRTPLSVSE